MLLIAVFYFQSEKVWTVKDALEGFVSKEQISGYNCPKTNAEVCFSCHCIMLKLYLLKEKKNNNRNSPTIFTI